MNHTIRHKDGETVTIDSYSPMRAIRAQCTECMGYQKNEVSKCTAPLCPLFPFRDAFDASVTRRAPLTEEQRKVLAERASNFLRKSGKVTETKGQIGGDVKKLAQEANP